MLSPALLQEKELLSLNLPLCILFTTEGLSRSGSWKQVHRRGVGVGDAQTTQCMDGM